MCDEHVVFGRQILYFEKDKSGDAAASLQSGYKTAAEQPGPATAVQQFDMSKFKSKVGSWECQAFLVNNNADKMVYAACETPRPGFKPAEKTEKRNRVSLSNLDSPLLLLDGIIGIDKVYSIVDKRAKRIDADGSHHFESSKRILVFWHA